MCLERVTSRPVDDNDWHVGYKVFKAYYIGAAESSTRFRLPFFCWDSVYDLGREYVDDETRIINNRECTVSYPCGFHLFDTVEDARIFSLNITYPSPVVIEVAYRRVVAIGIDESGLRTVVAKQMRLIKCV